MPSGAITFKRHDRVFINASKQQISIYVGKIKAEGKGVPQSRTDNNAICIMKRIVAYQILNNI